MNPIRQTLTKENFWNELNKEYPEGLKIFCDWIDEYKKEVSWQSLFPIIDRPNHWRDIKFHHLPYAMQLGIWLEFIHQRDDWEIDSLYDFDLEEDITKYVRQVLTLEALYG